MRESPHSLRKLVEWKPETITNPSVKAGALKAIFDEGFRKIIGTDNPDQESNQPKRYNQQAEADQFRDRFGNPINQAPLIPSTFQPQFTVPQFQLPPNPTLDGLRQQFSPESLAAAVKNGNGELIQAIVNAPRTPQKIRFA